MIGAAEAANRGIDWLNVAYVLTATIIAASVIVRTLQKLVRKAVEEVIDDRVRPHLEEDARRFAEINEKLAELRGRRWRQEL